MERKSEAAQIKLQKASLLPVVMAALKEDIGVRDLTTSALIPKGIWAKADLVVREEGIVAGICLAEWAFNAVDSRIRFKPVLRDGERVYPEKAIAYVEGPAQGILMAERTALNFLGRLSGIATLTRRFVEAIKPYRAQILDTRKTTPTLRLLEKYAVAMGGGTPHRMGLFDQVLIKDNHLRLVRGRNPIPSCVQAVRKKLGKDVPVEVEVKNLSEFRLGLAAGANLILLDNVAVPEIAEAVRLRNAVSRSTKAQKILLEVSGGVTLQNVKAIAATGVERISIGALTHSAPALDVALEVVG